MIFSFASWRAAVVAMMLLAATAMPLSAAGTAPQPEPVDALRAAIEAYRPEVAAQSKRAVADAFFLFEGSSLDRDLAARDPALYRRIESEWMRLLASVEGRKPKSEVDLQGGSVVALLEQGRSSAESQGSVFFDSFLIILREGFEAILIVSALAAYLTRIGQKERVPYLYGGAGIAVVASLVLWIAARSLIDLGGARREAFEGATVLVATAVLFWTSYWLVSKAEAEKWQAFVKSRVEQAVGRGALFGLGFLSFIVVFREGLETVLFYEAVAARAGDASGSSLLLAGFASGCVALACLYVAFQKLGPRIPMRAFFNVTGGLLYFMAFRFAGAGVRELQEAGVMDQTPVEFLSHSAFAADWLGIYPYVEPLVLQGVLVALAVFAFFYALRPMRSAAVSRERVAEKRRATAGY
jgi:high-affinity iron transporter